MLRVLLAFLGLSTSRISHTAQLLGFTGWYLSTLSEIRALKCVILRQIARVDDYILLLGTTSRYLSDIAQIYRDLGYDLGLLGGLEL